MLFFKQVRAYKWLNVYWEALKMSSETSIKSNDKNSIHITLERIKFFFYPLLFHITTVRIIVVWLFVLLFFCNSRTAATYGVHEMRTKLTDLSPNLESFIVGSDNRLNDECYSTSFCNTENIIQTIYNCIHKYCLSYLTKNFWKKNFNLKIKLCIDLLATEATGKIDA